MNKQCNCRTGPRGQGPQCKKNALYGHDVCGIHVKKCLNKIVQHSKSPNNLVEREQDDSFGHISKSLYSPTFNIQTLSLIHI